MACKLGSLIDQPCVGNIHDTVNVSVSVSKCEYKSKGTSLGQWERDFPCSGLLWPGHWSPDLTQDIQLSEGAIQILEVRNSGQQASPIRITLSSSIQIVRYFHYCSLVLQFYGSRNKCEDTFIALYCWHFREIVPPLIYLVAEDELLQGLFYDTL